MRRWLLLLVIISSFHLFTFSPVRGDPFDRYINTVLARVPKADGAQEIKKLTPALILDNDRVLPNTTGCLITVLTNDNRHSKLLVQTARQKLDANRSVPILLIERLVTYREGTDQTIVAQARNVYLFGGFRLSLDLGQVVPEEVGGDLRFVVDGDRYWVEPLGKAKLFLVTKPLPEAAPKKTTKLVVGETFEPRYFAGTYQLHDDGRRSGKLTLEVKDNGEIAGHYISDKDGQKYEVYGKVGMPRYAVQFTIKFPRTEQQFQGWLFTGDGKYLTGSSRMQEREAGFVAVRVEEE
jgi:hypothetical protein